MAVFANLCYLNYLGGIVIVGMSRHREFLGAPPHSVYSELRPDFLTLFLSSAVTTLSNTLL